MGPEDRAGFIQDELLACVEARAGHPEGEGEHEGQQAEGRAHDGAGGYLLAFRHVRPAPRAEPEPDLVAGEKQQHGPSIEQPHRA